MGGWRPWRDSLSLISESGPFARFLPSVEQRWGRVVKEAGIQFE